MSKTKTLTAPERAAVLMANMAKLPELCYGVHLSSGETVVLKAGEAGYHDTGYGQQGEAAVNSLNERMGVSRQQRAAMEFGSVIGFDVPGADPDLYAGDGRRVRSPDYLAA